MSVAKAERLLDLVIALLSAPRQRSASWIQGHVAGYDDAASDEAFARMFERDKQELRDLGIPLEVHDDGYLIRPGRFALPAISFTPAESAALAVATRLWETTALRESGPAALRKLQDAAEVGDGPGDGAAEPVAAGPVQIRVRTAEPTFPTLLAALRSRRAVKFDYRAAGSAALTARHLQPWGMANIRGAWYVAGWDVDRGAQRTFRLSRIVGEVAASGRADAVQVPAGFDIRTAVRSAHPPDPTERALLRVRVGAADGLWRRAELRHSDDQGFDELSVAMTGLTDMARRIAAHGPDVIVMDPPELREAVIDLLSRAAAPHEVG